MSDNVVENVVPYKNIAALTSYYTGVFSIIPVVGALLGPVALITGVLGLKKVKENPESKGGFHCWVGIVLGALVSLAHLAIVVLILS